MRPNDNRRTRPDAENTIKDNVNLTAELRNPLSPHQQKVKDEFIRKRGYWASFWDGMLAISPEFIENFTEFASIPQKTGTLGPKVRELVYIAIDASARTCTSPACGFISVTR